MSANKDAIISTVKDFKIEPKLEDQFPSVDLAYSIALSSYEMAQKRFEVMDNKLHSLLTFGVTIALAVPVVLKGQGFNFKSYWFIAASVVFGLAIIVGLIARLWGTIALPRPQKLHEDWLHLETVVFKMDFICFAGKHFEHNCKVVNRKGWLATISAFLFFVTATFLAVWILRH